MSWKTVIYEYVQNRSQMELNYAAAPALSAVRDETFAELLNERAKMTMLLHMERNVRPKRHETRLKLIEAVEQDGDVYAEIQMNRLMVYECGGRKCREERSEREKLRLSLQNGRWTIVGITPSRTEAYDSEERRIRERNGRPGQTFADSSDTITEAMPLDVDDIVVVKSTPFIDSRRVYTGYEGQRYVTYNREKARDYAEMWWDGANPQYENFEVDCSSFVSQCLFAGGAPMNYTGKRDAGWWYRGKSGHQELWSYSWAVANALEGYLASGSRRGLSATIVGSPMELELGDVISYSWEGGAYRHSTIVTAFDGFGMPLVNAHTVNSRHRYWDYRDSYAWTERTKYRFFHIADSMQG